MSDVPPLFSCSEASLACGEPLAGSAGNAKVLLAFSWPKPAWHADKVALSTGAPDDLATLEAEQKSAGRKIVLRAFQRGVAPSTSEVELIAVEPDTQRSLHLRDVPAGTLGTRMRGFLRGDDLGPPLARPLILACTDGRHDRCCAVRGRLLHQALLQAAEHSGAAVDVAECSHLGGHRLAATCIALPSGRMHGRLDAGDAPALVEAVLHDSAYAAHYRGRLGQSELEQVAEAEAFARFPKALVRKIEVGDDGHASVRLDVGGRTQALELRCRREEFASAGSCADLGTTETRERWVAQG